MTCPNCGLPMSPVKQHYECRGVMMMYEPTETWINGCGYIAPCCEGEPQ